MSIGNRDSDDKHPGLRVTSSSFQNLRFHRVLAILVQEVREAIAAAEIIEDYPTDKYGSSVLLLGFTYQQRPLHIQCSYPARPLVKIITLYEPDPCRWIDYRSRR